MEKKVKEKGVISRMSRHFLKTLLTGVATVIPVWVTYIVLKFVFQFTDGFLRPFIAKYYAINIPGTGFILMIILLYLLGTFSANVLGKKIIKQTEKLFLKIPIVKPVYNLVKQVIDALSIPGKNAFKRVVLASFMDSKVKAIGFVTGSSMDKNGKEYIHVFVPTTPNPTSGFLEFLRADQIIETDLTIEEGIKLVLSGGVIGAVKI